MDRTHIRHSPSRLIELRAGSISHWRDMLSALSDSTFRRGVWLRGLDADIVHVSFYYNACGELCESGSYFDIDVVHTREQVLAMVICALDIKPDRLLILEDFSAYAASQLKMWALSQTAGIYYDMWWDHVEHFCVLRNLKLCRQLRYVFPIDFVAGLDALTLTAVLNGQDAYEPQSSDAMPEDLVH